jgi:hypothetical protein
MENRYALIQLKPLWSLDSTIYTHCVEVLKHSKNRKKLILKAIDKKHYNLEKVKD